MTRPLALPAVGAPARSPRPAPRPRRTSGPSRAPRSAARIDTVPIRRLDRLLDRLIGSRAWIGIVAFALIGIVAMQLWVVKVGAGIGRALEHQALLQRENTTLAIEDSALSSGERIERLAAAAGLVQAQPRALHFDTVRGPLDARLAAAALARPAQPAGTPTVEASAGSPIGEASSATSPPPEASTATTPSTEVSAATSPVTEASAVSSPTTEAPAATPPATEASTASSPTTEAPAATSPASEAPTASTGTTQPPAGGSTEAAAGG
jgi:hypothetical protein